MKFGGWVVMLVTFVVFLEFLGIPTGLSIVLQSFGVNINSNTGDLVSFGLDGSTFWTTILAALLVISAGGAVIIGLFAKSYDTSLIIAPLIVAIAGIMIGIFGGTILYVVTLGQRWMTMLISTLFIALGVGFIMSCVDYFAGR